jgi:hypothetical protein
MRFLLCPFWQAAGVKEQTAKRAGTVEDQGLQKEETP